MTQTRGESLFTELSSASKIDRDKAVLSLKSYVSNNDDDIFKQVHNILKQFSKGKFCARRM